MKMEPASFSEGQARSVGCPVKSRLVLLLGKSAERAKGPSADAKKEKSKSLPAISLKEY